MTGLWTMPTSGAGDGTSPTGGPGTDREAPAWTLPAGRGATGPGAATGLRLAWGALRPGCGRRWRRRLGGRVVEAVTQPGGFSPGVAAAAAAGRRAAGVRQGRRARAEPRQSRACTAARPGSWPCSPARPRLPGCCGRSTGDGWVALAFEDVDGAQPALPWRPGELRRVLEMVATMAAALTPAPAGIPADRRPSPGQLRRLAPTWPPPTPPATTTWPASTRGRPAT